jgi:hypothetical protein
MSSKSDDLFNVTMTKAEAAAANEVWDYIKNNSIGMQSLSIPENTQTNQTIQKVVITKINENGQRFILNDKKSFLATVNKIVPISEIDEFEFGYLDKTLHRVYSPTGDEMLVVPFEIACAPSVSFSTIIGNENFSSSSILQKSSESICNELDQQVYKLLKAAVINKKMSKSDVDEYLKVQPLHEPFYKCLIVSRSFANDNRISWNKKITDDDFRVMNAGYLKCKNEMSIPVHFMASEEEGIIFVGDRSGYLIIDHKPYVIKNRDALKLRVNLIIFISVGIVAFATSGAYYKEEASK